MSEVLSYREFAESVAYEAGKIMLRYFLAAEKHLEYKTDLSPVTLADKQVNRMFIESVNEHFSNHDVIGEEESAINNAGSHVWVCDPIDGTRAFMEGLPTGMFGAGLVVDGMPIVGVAYDPFMDRLFSAAYGQGATLNGNPIKVSSKKLNGGIYGGAGSPSAINKSMKLYEDLEKQGATVALYSGHIYKCCLIAEGRMEGRIFTRKGAHDLAAVKVIVEEAGGVVTDLAGNDQRYDQPINGAVISNGVTHNDLLAAVKRHKLVVA